MKKVLFLFGLLLMLACSDEPISPKGTEIERPVQKDNYLFDYNGDNMELEIDSTMWYVVLPKETYNKIEAERALRGEKSVAEAMYISENFFASSSEGLIEPSVKDYIGCVKTYVKRDELSSLDSCVYKGVVYKLDDKFFNRSPNYNAIDFYVHVILHDEEDVDKLEQIAEEYALTIYEKTDMFNGTMYSLLYTNGYYGMSMGSIVNYLNESGLFRKVYYNWAAEWNFLS